MDCLLDIPTGNEPVEELCCKLQAVENTLKGFHGEIEEVINALDLSSVVSHFLSDAFIKNINPFVLLNTGNCLIQLVKMFSPRVQHLSSSHLEDLLSFLTRNISLLKDPSADWFDLCFQFVQNLHTSRTMSIVHFVDDSQFVVEWCSNLFRKVFQSIRNSTKRARNELQQLLQTVISDLVQMEDAEPILDAIYLQIMDQVENPTTYEFIKSLLHVCHRDLEHPTQQFFMHHLQGKNCSSDLEIVSRKYELIKTLYCACPQLVTLALGGLQSCLEASKLTESSLDLVLALGKMFAAINVNLAQECNRLWFSFLRSLRSGDKQVQCAGLAEISNIIRSHPELIENCWKYFMLHCAKEGTPDIVENVFRCLAAVCCDDDLSHNNYGLQILNELVADSSVIVREQAFKLLARILGNSLICPMNIELKPKCIEMTFSIMNYYKYGDNRAKSFVQHLYVDHLIPLTLPAEDKVLRLLHLWLLLTKDLRAVFHDIQRDSFFFRKRLQDALELCNKPSSMRPELKLQALVVWISGKLDRPGSHEDHLALTEFFIYSRSNTALEMLKKVADPVSYSTMDRILAATDILKTLKMQKPNIYPVIKQLCTKLTMDLFDKNALSVLLNWIHHCVVHEQTPVRIFCSAHEMATEGLKLMSEVLFHSPHLAFDWSSVTKLVEILEATPSSGITYTTWVLKVMAVMSMHNSFKNVYPNFFDEFLMPVLKKFTLSGTVSESKFAVQTLANHLRGERLVPLQQLMKKVYEKAKLQDSHYVTLITAAAYLNAFIPWNVTVSFRKIVPHFLHMIFGLELLQNLLFTREAIFKQQEALMEGNLPLPKRVCVDRIVFAHDLPNGNLYDDDKIPTNIQSLMATIKTASGLVITRAHWEEDEEKSKNIKQTYCGLLTLICLNEMYNSLEAVPLRDEDKACLRLTAGSVLLKLCQWPAFWEVMPVESFVALSHLMVDGVKELKLKLCRKLTRKLTHETSSLPVDFLAFFVVALFEDDKCLREEIKDMLKVAMISKRMVYRHHMFVTDECNTFVKLAKKKPQLLVENSLVVAIFLLAHNPLFHSTSEVPVLQVVENSLNILLTELQEGTDKLPVNVWADVLKRLKSLRSCLLPENKDVHDKIFVVCNLVLEQLEILKKRPRKTPYEIPVSSKYFQTY